MTQILVLRSWSLSNLMERKTGPLTWMSVLLLLLLRKMLGWFLENMLKPHEEYTLENR